MCRSKYGIISNGMSCCFRQYTTLQDTNNVTGNATRLNNNSSLSRSHFTTRSKSCHKWSTEYDHLCLNQKKPIHVKVSRAYFGKQNVTMTMLFGLSTAIRLSHEIIDCIGDTANTEELSLCIKSDNFETGSRNTINAVMSKVDCRVFRCFVNLTKTKNI